MVPGPAKSFDADIALERARDVFWTRGYAATSISELESAMGIGRKSLYDTFGGKRDLYLRALEQYTDTVIDKICRGLEDPRSDALQNLERVLDRLQRHHGSTASRGCLLGVAMAQADPGDSEFSELIRGYLQRLETAFERNIHAAQRDGTVDPDARPKDVARQLVAVTQGIALLGRITDGAPMPRSIVRATMRALKI